MLAKLAHLPSCHAGSDEEPSQETAEPAATVSPAAAAEQWCVHLASTRFSRSPRLFPPGKRKFNGNAGGGNNWKRHNNGGGKQGGGGKNGGGKGKGKQNNGGGSTAAQTKAAIDSLTSLLDQQTATK